MFILIGHSDQGPGRSRGNTPPEHKMDSASDEEFDTSQSQAQVSVTTARDRCGFPD